MKALQPGEVKITMTGEDGDHAVFTIRISEEGIIDIDLDGDEILLSIDDEIDEQTGGEIVLDMEIEAPVE